MTGRIKFYNEDKAFGFITVSDNQDYFFHKKNCKSKITAADKDAEVTFETEEGKKGIMAVDVTLSE